VYTVTSRSALPTERALQAADAVPVPDTVLDAFAQTPKATNRVRALALEITAPASTTYDKIIAIEAWLSAHVRYSLNAPLAPTGVDVVDDFLFRARIGWCEQVASSLVVPARLVDGRVRRTRARRARVGGDLLSRDRLAAVRSDRVGTARR